ncbi:carbohydrate kinase [candidate division KSB1 bacterium]
MGRATHKQRPIIFGEVLFDILPDGTSVLGGAPFNVAWHLAGFGFSPLMISRVGNDRNGDTILSAMKEWEMDTSGIQRDEVKPSGQVTVSFVDGQPTYTILADQAYDYIDSTEALSSIQNENWSLLYHGTLALRFATTRTTFDMLRSSLGIPGFYDVNLRKPWWNIKRVKWYLTGNQWIKCNLDELRMIAQIADRDDSAVRPAAEELMKDHDIELLIATDGKNGATVFEKGGNVLSAMKRLDTADIEDTVGAGDAFSSVFIIGLLESWQVETILERAVHFAARICAIKGATTPDRQLYQNFREQWRTDSDSRR